MDFSNDDELDYEEDNLENDSVQNDLQNKSSGGDEANQNSNLSEVDDQYLQVNCPEEEKSFIEKAYIENTYFQSKNVKKADEESEKPEPEEPLPKEKSLQTKELSKSTETNAKTNKRNNNKCKKRGRSFHYRRGVKKQVTNPFCSPQPTFNSRRNVSENFRIRVEKKIVLPSFRNQNSGKIISKGFNKCEKSESRFFQLKYEERELMKLKKEARLKRFMHDEVVKKETKFNHSACENEIPISLHLGQEYLKKIEEQKLMRENLLNFKSRSRRDKETNSSGESNPYISTEKPEINKESLLKKRNPFESGLKTSNCSLAVKIKEEDGGLEDVKNEISFNKLLVPASDKFLEKEETKIFPISQSSEQRFGVGVFKNEASFPVKFVRTVSKSFDELALRKPKMGLPDSKDELSFSSYANTLPLVAANKRIFSTSAFPAQVESQLIGCIVKVFNIPPSITTNDVLALCNPIGIVKEIKINLPKENSVVIRFADPSCAENFFSVYHGQKMNNYFLNVIVV